MRDAIPIPCPRRPPRRWAAFAAAALALAPLACDDEGGGTGDGGRDGVTRDAPRFDRTPILACDPTDTAACAAGTKCTIANAVCDLACGPVGRVAAGGDCDERPGADGRVPVERACRAGLGCLYDPLVGRTRCLRFCLFDEDCDGDPEPPDSRCNLTAVGCPAEVRFCGPAIEVCDLLHPERDCASGQGCYLLASGGTGCLPAGTVPVGQACGTAHTGHCVAGALCAGDPGPPPRYTCGRICNAAGGAPACPRGEECRPLAGADGAGVCARPGK